MSKEVNYSLLVMVPCLNILTKLNAHQYWIKLRVKEIYNSWSCNTRSRSVRLRQTDKARLFFEWITWWSIHKDPSRRIDPHFLVDFCELCYETFFFFVTNTLRKEVFVLGIRWRIHEWKTLQCRKTSVIS